MKAMFPSYRESGTGFIEGKLTAKDKKILDDFCKYCRISCGDRKIRVIRATLLQFRDITEKEYSKIDLKDLRDFLVLLNQAPLSEWTKRDYKKFIKKFLKEIFKDWSRRFNEFRDVRPVSMRKAFNGKKINENTLITKEELEKLLRACQTLKWKAILTLLYESACRPQELRLLKWKDIRYTDEGADITFYSEKTREARTLPVKDCVVHLKRWEQEYQFPDKRADDIVFPSHKRGVIMSNNALPKTLKEICRTAGIRLIHPYLFRHTRLTFLYKKFPEQIVKKYAGHSADSKMPIIYSHISSKNVREVLLEELYNVKELTDEQRNKYDQEIEDLKKQLKQQEPAIQFLLKQIAKVQGINLPADFDYEYNDKLKAGEIRIVRD
jgi:integrase